MRIFFTILFPKFQVIRLNAVSPNQIAVFFNNQNLVKQIINILDFLHRYHQGNEISETTTFNWAVMPSHFTCRIQDVNWAYIIEPSSVRSIYVLCSGVWGVFEHLRGTGRSSIAQNERLAKFKLQIKML